MRSYQLSAISRQFIITLVFIALIGCGDSPPDPVTPAVSVAPPVTPTSVRALPEAILPDGDRLTLELALTVDEISQGTDVQKLIAQRQGHVVYFQGRAGSQFLDEKHPNSPGHGVSLLRRNHRRYHP